MLRIAVVTPYYKESTAILRQCHESVLNQTYPCQHIVVSDGHPDSLFDNSQNALHIRLPSASADNGNTPRAIGGIFAETRGFDAVAYLDADNWFDPIHIETLVAAQEMSRCPVAASRRKFCNLQGAPLDVREKDEETYNHVDTSCWLVTRPAFHLLRAWLMPKELSAVCDRIFFLKVCHDRQQIAPTNRSTVNFRTQYSIHYQAAGVAPPPGAKTVDDVIRKAEAYLATEKGAAELKKFLGLPAARG